jgi:predicted RNA-binding Zn-ribbon protein involved in translation (DUF1610 family)
MPWTPYTGHVCPICGEWVHTNDDYDLEIDMCIDCGVRLGLTVQATYHDFPEVELDGTDSDES